MTWLLRRTHPLLWAIALASCASSPRALDSEQLALELARRPVVLLGEVHDNTAQHRARAEAVRRLLERGARPALAFEQFDRERQADIERARRETPPAGRSLATHIIEQASTPRANWDWDQYRPFVELALQYELPIVAANLSRAAASRVAREGPDAVFTESERRDLALGLVEDALLPEHEGIVQKAHCDALPPALVPGLARAQIARDAVLAAALRPYFERGVVLLTGNGHARRDIGVPRHLSEAEQARVWTIGLLEQGDRSTTMFDAAFVGPVHPRADPCEQFRRAPPAAPSS
jgi:uncharacterized iron-regulated protein